MVDALTQCVVGHSQSQSSYRGRTRWTSVDMKIWSKTQEAVDKMIERIDRHIKQSQTTKNEKDKIICSFSAQQVPLLILLILSA